MDKEEKITGKVLGYTILDVYPQGTYEYYYYLDCDIIVKIKGNFIIKGIDCYDLVESTGKLFSGTLIANSIRVIKKYIPPQKKIGDFLK